MFLTGHHRKSQSGRFWTTVYRSRHIDQWTLRMIDDIIRLARHVPTAPQSGEISNGHRHTHTRADTHTVWWKNSSCTELSYIPACLCVCVHQVDIEQPQLSQYIQSEQLRTHTLTHTQREKTRERETEREGKRKGKGEERDTDGKWEKDRERKLAQWPCHLSINQVATWALSLLSLPLSLSLTHTHFQQYCSNREKDIWLFGLDDNSIL